VIRFVKAHFISVDMVTILHKEGRGGSHLFVNPLPIFHNKKLINRPGHFPLMYGKSMFLTNKIASLGFVSYSFILNTCAVHLFVSYFIPK